MTRFGIVTRAVLETTASIMFVSIAWYFIVLGFSLLSAWPLE